MEAFRPVAALLSLGFAFGAVGSPLAAEKQPGTGFLEVTWTIDTNGYEGFSKLSIRGLFQVVPVDFAPPDFQLPGTRDLEIPFMLAYQGGGLISAIGEFGGERATFRAGDRGAGGIALALGDFPDHSVPAGADGVVRRNKRTGAVEIFAGPGVSLHADGPGEAASGCWGEFPEIVLTQAQWRDIETRPLKPFTKPVDMPEAPECRGVMKIEVRAKIPEPEVVLEPLSEGEYRDWIPGFVDARRGSLVAFRCRTKDGKRKGTFTFRLPEAEVSKEPGRCLNYPPPDTNDPEKYDLVFAAKEFQQERDAAISAGGLELRTREEKTEAVAVVESRDYGAYGHLRCDVAVAAGGSDPVEAKDPKTGLTFIPIPRDDDGNHIADRWQELHGVGKKAADADDEADPPGYGHGHPGDGYTLYEEYRGFFEGGNHTRFTPAEPDPKRKDLYVRNLAGEPAEEGISLFAALSRLKVHPGILDGEHRLRVLNFRSGSAHRVSQHLVQLLGFSEDPAYQDAGLTHHYEWLDSGAVGTPKDYLGITLPAPFRAQQLSLPRARTIAHELLHACGVKHHGDKDEHGVPFVHGVDRIYSEQPRAELTMPGDFTKFELVAVRGGQHSGAEDCVMRYANASYYRVAEHVYYRSDPPDVKGSGLCTDRKGTGVNDEKRKPHPRYGDAAPGRGNCASQICVSDAYDHPKR